MWNCEIFLQYFWVTSYEDFPLRLLLKKQNKFDKDCAALSVLSVPLGPGLLTGSRPKTVKDIKPDYDISLSAL